MATQLEPLNIRITGSSEGLSSELAKAKGSTSAFTGSINGLSGSMGGLALKAGAIGLAVAGAFKAIETAALPVRFVVEETIEQFSRIDEIADAANRLGVSFTELKGIRLALGEATGLGGEQIDSAVAKFQLNLTEAAVEGSGKVYETLERLGLNAQELLAAGPVKAIEMISAKTSELQSPTDQLRIAFDLFGKSGVGLANALRQGPEALEASYEWATKNLGLTDAQVEAVGRVNDSWDRIGLLAEAFFQVIAAEAAPAVEGLLNYAIGLADEWGGVQEAAEGLVTWTVQIAGYTADWLELVTLGHKLLWEIATADFSGAFSGIEEAFKFDKAEQYLEALEQSRENMKQADSEKKQFNESDIARIEAEERARKAALEAQKQAAEAAAKQSAQWAQQGEKLNRQLAATYGSGDGVLSATTDRAAQIRRAAEIQASSSRAASERERIERERQALIAAQEAAGYLKTLADNSRPEAGTINL